MAAEGFVGGVHARAGHQAVDAGEAGAGQGEADPVVVIHAEVEARIERADTLDDGAAEEDGGLADVAAFLEALEVPVFGGVGFEDLVVLVDVVGVAVDDVDFGMGGEEIAGGFDGAGVIDVVGIHPAEDFTVGTLDTFIDGIALAVVFFRDPLDAVAVAAEDGHGFVAAAAIHDEVFQGAGELLRQHALDGALDEASLVV